MMMLSVIIYVGLRVVVEIRDDALRHVHTLEQFRCESASLVR